ncbi:putative F-box domain, leucine-rich repeat domain superfamily, F-box-like domain superfamily [Helianthus annuus]|nr:putative F-box domain, leucine-rich repeat domain superfamily, F-box-like domain superfamily [Helianthus annuus]
MMDIILCDELLQEIFQRLPPPSSSAVSLVSKRWRHLLRSSLSSLTLRLSPNHLSLSSLTSFLSDHTYLSSLSLSTTTTTGTTTVFSDRLLISISPPAVTSRASLSPPVLSLCFLILSRPILSLHFLTAFNCLKILTLTVIGNGSTETVSDHITSNSTTDLQLQSISLIGIRADDYALNWLWRNCSFETLTKLVFENCNGIGGNQPFSRFITRLTNLHELELKICRSIVALVLLNLAENCSNSLSSLLIYDGGNRESLLHFIRETNCNLQKLDLRLPLDLDDSHLIEIGAKFDRLRVLRLQSCAMVTGEGLKTLGLGLSDSLEELALTNCDVIKRETGFLVELAQSLRNVKTLDLSYNHMLIDKEFASMISSYRELRKLNIRGCSRLTDISLISLCKNCKHLKSVDLLYCNGIWVEGVEDRKLSEASRRWMASKFIEVQS